MCFMTLPILRSIHIYIPGQQQLPTGVKPMTNEPYDDKRGELETSYPVFTVFVSTMGLIAAAMLLIELAL